MGAHADDSLVKKPSWKEPGTFKFHHPLLGGPPPRTHVPPAPGTWGAVGQAHRPSLGLRGGQSDPLGKEEMEGVARYAGLLTSTGQGQRRRLGPSQPVDGPLALWLPGLGSQPPVRPLLCRSQVVGVPLTWSLPSVHTSPTANREPPQSHLLRNWSISC